MQGSILGIKFMDLASITLRMVIITKDHGMKGVSKGTECILFEMVKPDVVNGTVETSRLAFPHFLMQFFEQFR